MTERVPESNFDKITEAFGDPVIMRIIRDLRLAEEVINSADRALTLEEKQTLLTSCNNDLEREGVRGSRVLYSGKLRPLFEPESTEEEAALVKAYGTCFSDDDGGYYIVHKEPFVCGGIDVEQPDEYASAGVKHRAYIHLDIPGNTADGDGPDCKYVYLDDVDILELEDPSFEKLLRDIKSDFPEIAAQIAELPKNCGNDKKIMDALRSFRLTINWDECLAKTSEEREQLIRNFGTYITEYLKFDTDMYRMRIKDSYIIIDTAGNEVAKRLANPVLISGHSFQVALVKLGANGNTNVETYVPVIQLIASAKGRGNGSTSVSVPAANIVNIANMRNNQLFDPSVVEEEPATLPPSQDNIVYAEPAVTKSETVEISMQPETLGEHTQSLADSYKELTDLNTCLKEVLEAAEKVCSAVYDSKEDAFKAYNALTELGQAFMDIYVKNPLHVEASGPGVRLLTDETKSDYNEETNRIDIHLPALSSMKNGDMFTTKTGQIQTLVAMVDTHDDEPNKFVIKAEFVLTDAELSDPIMMPDQKTGIPVMIVRSQTNFMAALTDQTHMAIPAYERLKKCANLISALATDSPELKFLPWNLTELQAMIENSNNRGYDQLNDLSLLSRISEDSLTDATVTRRVVNVLSEILVGRPLKIDGAMYDPDGALIDNYSVIGSVTDVVDSAPHVDAKGPLLVIDEAMSNGSDKWHVPLATIKKFEY